MPRHILLADLGLGDSGKGTITDSLVRRHKIPLVVRYSGGAQCAHNVVTNEGVHHTFAQFGSGTLAGASTWLTKNVIIDPIRLINEGDLLCEKVGQNVFNRLNINRDCLVITPFHRALNQLKEIARGESRHGSCGIGVGETVRHALSFRSSMIRASDLGHQDVDFMLETVRNDLILEAGLLLEQIRTDWRSDTCRTQEADELFRIFTDENVIDAYSYRYHLARAQLFIRGDAELSDDLNRYDTVFEGAQGVLLDEDYGFHPYTTWSKVTLTNAVETLRAAGITDYTTLGILRAFATRHGAGPLPTESKALTKKLTDPYNPTNPWQGGFRVGHFDGVLACYGARIAGRIDGLALTHLDQVRKMPQWRMALSYGSIDNHPISLRADDFAARTQQTEALMKLKSRDLEYRCATQPSCADVISIISGSLDIPCQICSYGPTSSDKEWVGSP